MSTIANEYDALVSVIEAAVPSRVYDGAPRFRLDPAAFEESEVALRAYTRAFILLPLGDRQWQGEIAEQPELRGITQTLQLVMLYRRGQQTAETMKAILEDQDTLAAAIALPSTYSENVSLRRIGSPSIAIPSGATDGLTMLMPITITYDAE
ncbi:MAG: hypothetical protein IV100_17825 [Myxococcales bacterium]|nr:hypothetical protein [Myxococcales bacterium]